MFDPGEHIEHLIRLAKGIDTQVITMLTGLNGSGKSLIRKVLREVLESRLGRKPKLVHASQELRTSSNPAMGAFSSAAHDLSWLATGVNTLHVLEQCLKHKACDYLVLDEPEIGMGEELQLGLVEWLNEELQGRSHGVLVICHSRLVVNGLRADAFINIEGMDKEGWLTRTPEPYDVKEFKERSSALFEAVRDRSNKRKR